MASKSTNELAGDVVSAIKETAGRVLPPRSSVWLFGSRARGDANDSSDWDLLVLVEQDANGYEQFTNYAYPFIDAGWRFGAQVNPKLYSHSEWKRGKGTPFYNNVMRERIEL